MGILLNIFGAIGFMSMSLLAMITDHWFDMMLMISFYPLLICFLFPFLPESFRWLFSKGELDIGAKTLEVFGKRCGKEIPSDRMAKIIQQNSPTIETGKVYTMAYLFSYPKTRITTIKMGYIWFALTMKREIIQLGRTDYGSG